MKFDELPVIEMAESATNIILMYRGRCPCAPPSVCPVCILADKVLGELGDYTR